MIFVPGVFFFLLFMTFSQPTPPRDYVPHHHQSQLSFQTGFNLGSSWTDVTFTICSPFLCTWCLCSVVIVFSLIPLVFIGCELLFLWRPSLLVVGERIKKAIILCGSKFFFFFRIPASSHVSVLCRCRHCGVLPGHRLQWWYVMGWWPIYHTYSTRLVAGIPYVW